MMTFIPPFPIYPPETAWMREFRTDIPGCNADFQSAVSPNSIRLSIEEFSPPISTGISFVRNLCQRSAKQSPLSGRH